MDAQHQENLIAGRDDLEDARADLTAAYDQFLKEISSFRDTIERHNLGGEELVKDLTIIAEAVEIEELAAVVDWAEEQVTLAAVVDWAEEQVTLADGLEYER